MCVETLEWFECGCLTQRSTAPCQEVIEGRITSDQCRIEQQHNNREGICKVHRRNECIWPYGCHEHQFQTQELLRTHMNDAHNGWKPWECPFPACGNGGYRAKANLKLHFTRIHAESLVGGGEEAEAGPSGSSGPRLANSWNDCLFPGCGKTYFMTPRLLIAHMDDQHDGWQPWACPYGECRNAAPAVVFANKSNLRRHIYLVHGFASHRGPPKAADETDSVSDSDASSLEEGEIRERPEQPHDDRVRPPPHNNCLFPACTAAFKTHVLLAAHMDAAHDHWQPWFCPVGTCPSSKSFSSKDNLHRHLVDKHGYEEWRKQGRGRNNACSFPPCGMDFADREGLVLHMDREHDGLRPWGCPWEGCKEKRIYKSRGALKYHMWARHSDEMQKMGEAEEGGNGAAGERGCGDEE